MGSKDQQNNRTAEVPNYKLTDRRTFTNAKSMLAVEYPGHMPFSEWSHASARGCIGPLRPVSSSRADVLPVRESVSEASLLKDTTVYVVAKESRAQGFIRSTLLSLGAEVYVASSSSEAIDLIKCVDGRHNMVFTDSKLLKSIMAECDSKAAATIANVPVAVLYVDGEAKESVSKAGTFYLAKPSHLQRTALVSLVQQMLATRTAQSATSTSSIEKTLSESNSETRDTSAHSDIQSPPTPPRCVTPPRLSSFNHSPSRSAFTRYSPQQQNARWASTSAPEPPCVPFYAPYPCGAMPPMHGRHMHPMPQPAFARHTSHASMDSGESPSGSEDPENARMANASRRAEALQRFREKRKRLTFEKKVRYASRKRLAENRPRLRGQFVRQTETCGSESPSSSADEE